jgi:hypothetical protein
MGKEMFAEYNHRSPVKLERHTHALAGAMILLSGVAIAVLGL